MIRKQPTEFKTNPTSITTLADALIFTEKLTDVLENCSNVLKLKLNEGRCQFKFTPGINLNHILTQRYRQLESANMFSS